MNSSRRLLMAYAPVMVGLLFSLAASGQEQLALTEKLSGSASEKTSLQANTSGKTSSQVNKDGSWHFDLTLYLWFAGAHGTVGALGRSASMHVSPGDLLSHFDFGLMGAAEARYERFLLNGDFLWIRLSDSRALPFPNLSSVSADVRAGQFIWTSKVGYRMLDHPKMKADANVGVRYWHLGQKLSFNPSRLGLNFNGSQQWADIVIGGHVQLPAGEKTVIDLAGDVGGWNATAKLDYQVVAALGFKISPKLTLLAGYRYLFVDYRPTNLSVFNVVTSGVVLGTRFTFK
jgi:hypothetical protein